MAVKDWFNRIRKKDIKLTGTLQNGSTFFYVTAGGAAFSNDTKTINGQLYAYKYCAPVTAVIQRLMQAGANGIVKLEDITGEDAKGKQADQIRLLLEKPNPLLTGKQFLNQLRIYYKLFGEVFIYPVQVYSNEYALFIIPNWIVKTRYKVNPNIQFSIVDPVEYWEVSTNQEILRLYPNEVWHFKNDIPNDEDIARGRSLLYSLDTVINNILIATEARRTLMEKKGALGILSNSSGNGVNFMPLTDEQKNEIQAAFQGYGLSRNQNQVIMTGATLSWQQMSFPTRDLLLFEEIEDDVRQICDTFGYPMHLLGFKAGTTFSNVNEAKKSSYQDTVIPDNEALFSWLSEKINMIFKTKFNLKIYYDHIEVLQENETEKATAFKTQTETVSSILTNTGLTKDQKIYMLVYFGEMSEDEAKTLVGNNQPQQVQI